MSRSLKSGAAGCRRKWRAAAPSNLALIKYMGKKQAAGKAPAGRNLPINPSLSLALNHFLSLVEIEEAEASDSWEPFAADPFQSGRMGKKSLFRSSKPLPLEPPLSFEERDRFLRFFRVLKRELFIPGNFRLRSAGNFPRAAGAASSASAFAALTRAAFALAKDKSLRKDQINSLGAADLSRLSRMGSGSSCRSFFSPWALWEGRAAAPLRLPGFWSGLIHQLVIAEFGAKPVSSSQAHKLVRTSPMFRGRVRRARRRFQDMLAAMKILDWKAACRLAWEEMEDLQSLFETSRPPVRYLTKASRDILRKARGGWSKAGDGPLVTMDAGPSVHLLFRPDQKRLIKESEALFSDYAVCAGSPARRV